MQQLSGAKRQRNVVGYQRNCLISRGTNVCGSISGRNRRILHDRQRQIIKSRDGDGRRNCWRDGRTVHCDKIRHYFPSNARSIDISRRTHSIFGRWNYRGGVRSEESFSISGDGHLWINCNFRLVDFKISYEFRL